MTENSKDKGYRRQSIHIEDAAMVYFDKNGDLKPVRVTGEYIDNCADCCCENIIQPCEACDLKSFKGRK